MTFRIESFVQASQKLFICGELSRSTKCWVSAYLMDKSNHVVVILVILSKKDLVAMEEGPPVDAPVAGAVLDPDRLRRHRGWKVKRTGPA